MNNSNAPVDAPKRVSVLLDRNALEILQTLEEHHPIKPSTSFSSHSSIMSSPVIIKDPKYMLKPESTLRVGWDLTTMVMLLYLAISMPFRVGFAYDATPGSFLFGFEFLLDLLFIVDVILNFRTGYFRTDGTVEMNYAKVMKNYLKGFFWIDFFSSVPWDLIISGLENLQGS